MSLRIALLAASVAFCLGGCEDVTLFGDDEAALPPASNGCTAAGCPQAASFCAARGYQEGTDAMRRCLYSVEQNLRADNR